MLVDSVSTTVCHPVLFLDLARPISPSLVRYTYMYMLLSDDIRVLCLSKIELCVCVCVTTGDLMSPPDLDRLLVLPYGCGEQNMVRFSLNVVTGLYLVHTKQLSELHAVKIRNNLQTGNVTTSYSHVGQLNMNMATVSMC